MEYKAKKLTTPCSFLLFKSQQSLNSLYWELALSDYALVKKKEVIRVL